MKCGAKCEVIRWSPFGIDVWCQVCTGAQGKTVWLGFGEYSMKVREVKGRE